jgi:hypothetical protein
MPISTIGTSSISALGYGFKNRILNGGMQIDQRNAGASVTPTNDSYSLDRWNFTVSQTSKFTTQQNAGSVTPPAGFANYLGVTSSSAYSVLTGDYFGLRQRIEGFNVADLGWGTSNAATVTLSFKVYSSLTGTFGGVLTNSAWDRSYPYTYTISAANTWTTISVTIAGDTSGTWLKTNGTGLVVLFGLGVGSTYSGTAGSWAGTTYVSATGATSVVGTNGATFYITGVQLEKGSVATSFDWRPYGTELQLCQRYFEKSYDQGTVAGTATATGANFSTMVGGTTNTNAIGSFIPFKVSKRTTATMSLWDTAGNSSKATRDNFGVGEQTNVSAFTQNTGDSSTQVYVNSGNAASGMKVHWTASAEL